MQTGVLVPADSIVGVGLTFCFPDRQTMAQNSLFLELLQMAIVDRCWILPYLARALGSSWCCW